MLDQIQTLCTTINQLNVGRKFVAALQCLDASHTKPFIGPQNVADAQHANGFGPVTRVVTGRLRQTGAYACIIPSKGVTNAGLIVQLGAQLFPGMETVPGGLQSQPKIGV